VTADQSGKPLSRITWRGLIRNGLDYLVSEGYVDTSDRRIKRAYEALEDPEVDGLLDAANIVSSQMKQHGQFSTWLESVFGSLSQEIRHPGLLDILKALHEKGATLLTTNYDDVLEEHCGLRRVGRSNQDGVLRFQRGDIDGVFHIHGSYHDAHEVVLDTTDYYEVKHSDGVQDMLKTFLQYKTILFVGCGSGIEDPNFDALLKWASEWHKNIPHRHCLLIRDDDGVNYQPLLRVKYGPRYEDLVVYLKRLLDDHTEAQSLARPPRTHEDYQIGVICALATEKAAMAAMLDETHFKLKKQHGDENEYTLGRIGIHNVVIACLPAGLMGNGPAAIVANNIQRSFPIKFGLMVGIGGGVWSKSNDIRLGDVVVGQPTGAYGGMMQWDFGKTGKVGKFQRTGSLNKPPPVLLHALQELKTFDLTDGVDIEGSISLMVQNKPRMGRTYRYQGADHDQLFEATYDHEGDETCDGCDPKLVVQRPAREDFTPRIHYGNIVSGNEVIKYSTTRDKIAMEEGVICFEIEAAGLMDNFRCLVIRGICDYADSHKNKIWQPYAAATAAAFARVLLGFVDEREVVKTSRKWIAFTRIRFLFSMSFVFKIVFHSLILYEDVLHFGYNFVMRLYSL
jgi:nucleoside phosphorylase